MDDLNFQKEQSLQEWYKIVEPIITNKDYIYRKQFKHHGDESLYTHMIRVSIRSYIIAKKLHLDYESAAIAGILHDFYVKPWNNYEKRKFFEQHGFTHARTSLENSRLHFSKYLNPEIENAILRHMFPLNIIPPKHSIGWIVSIADKSVSFNMFTSKESMAGVLKGITRRSK